MALRFWKYHGLGNDFVLVDGPLMEPARARRICDRHRGIGADGVVTVLPPRTPGALAAGLLAAAGDAAHALPWLVRAAERSERITSGSVTSVSRTTTMCRRRVE